MYSTVCNNADWNTLSTLCDFLFMDGVVMCLLYVGVANLYEKYCISYLRSWAASECLKQIKGDDQFTNCISIGPVSNCETEYYRV